MTLSEAKAVIINNTASGYVVNNDPVPRGELGVLGCPEKKKSTQ
jgi:hypothetical protein